jgi:hypothetical protein
LDELFKVKEHTIRVEHHLEVARKDLQQA